MDTFLTVYNVLLVIFFAGVAAALFGLATARQLAWKISLIIAVLAACGAALYPPQDKLRLGLDLRGGTSLLYDVTIPEGRDRTQALKQTVDVLRRRVDPQDSRGISWRIDQAGRIEIQMPRPSTEVSTRRAAVDEVKDRIDSANVRRSGVQLAVATKSNRQAALDELVRGVESRRSLLSLAATAYDAYQAARKDYESVGEDGSKRAALALKVAEAQAAYDASVSAVVATNLDLANLERIAELSTVDRKDEDGVTIEGSSPRAMALEKLRNKHTARGTEIDDFVERFDAYVVVKGHLEDHEDLIRMLRGSGVLEFRITVAQSEVPNVDDLRQQLAERGPRFNSGDTMVWMAIDDPDRFADTLAERQAFSEDAVAFLANRRGLIGAMYGGEAHVLLWNTEDKSMARRPSQEGWGVRNPQQAIDSMFLPAVSFSLNPTGATLMSQMSGENIQRQMAMVLDGRVLSTPVIQSKLSSNVLISGGTGGFSRLEQNYLVSTLKAGSLDARLSEEPISVTKVGSKYGEDNLRRGLEAAIDALIIVAIFMAIYYFFAGCVANAALFANIVIILGIMALRQEAFTLPGIAGIVLTIGMCVDANVLVFERIREELSRGNEMAASLRLGYNRALSAIIDGNITNLIVCVILYLTASAQVRGFAITLGIGICATLFTSLFMTRVIFEVWGRLFHIKRLNMLPSVVKPLESLLHPKVNWVSLRWMFFGVSLIAVVSSLTLCFSRGEDLLDIEFRGGTQVAFDLKTDPATDVPMTMKLGDVREDVKQVGLWFADPSTVTAEDREVFDALSQRVTERQAQLEAEAWAKIERSGQLENMSDEEQAQLEQTTKAQAKIDAAAATDLSLLRDATVVAVGDMTEDLQASQFSVAATVSDSRTVAAVIKTLFAAKLDTTSSLRFAGQQIERVSDAGTMVLPITRSSLSEVIGLRVIDETEDVTLDDRGGVAIVLRDIQSPTTIDDIAKRIKAMRNQPDYEDQPYRPTRVVGLEVDPDNPALYTAVAVVSRDTNISYFDSPEDWEAMAQSEWSLVRDAMSRDTSLSSVSNFTPTVARTIQQQAIVALLISILAIVVYIWFRFGSLRFGLAATVALVHDVTIAMGFIAITGFVFEQDWARSLLIGSYKINLPLIAALLTIVGYSLNDTIVVFDRIRENRGKLAVATPGVINDSINQTISRTLLTSGTTLLAVFMLYAFGGEGVREFAFALLIGVGVGTYSSVAVAAPILSLGQSLGAKPDPMKEIEA